MYQPFLVIIQLYYHNNITFYSLSVFHRLLCCAYHATQCPKAAVSVYDNLPAQFMFSLLR